MRRCDLPLFTIGTNGPRFFNRNAVAAEQFALHRAIVAPVAIEESLLVAVTKLADRGVWVEDVHALGDFLTEPTPLAGRAMELTLQHPTLLRWLEAVTGCASLSAVQGHIARTLPHENHRLRWHNDLNVPNRRLAITVNLSDAPYEGAIFELRDVATKTDLFRFVHRRLGDAVIFEVASRSEHRVTRMVAGGPRCVFAGWFVGPS
jgi:hypothetical protein